MTKLKYKQFSYDFILEKGFILIHQYYSSIGIKCERCGQFPVKYVNLIVVDEEKLILRIGDNCYNELIRRKSVKDGKSISDVKREIEATYRRDLVNKALKMSEEDSIKAEEELLERVPLLYKKRKLTPEEYSNYLTLKWDMEKSNLPDSRKEEFKKLLEKMEGN